MSRPDVLELVDLRDADVISTGLQLMVLNLAEDLKVCREAQVEIAFVHVVVPDISRHRTLSR